MRSMVSACTLAPAVFCLTSMSGDSPVTFTVSETRANFHGKVDFEDFVLVPAGCRSDLDGWKPCSVAVTS